MYTAPLAEGLLDGDLRAFVYGKQVRSAPVGRRLGIDDTLRDDGFFACGVTMMQP